MGINEIKDLVARSNKITILTGAGLSTASGIPDFRSPGGIWSNYKTVTYQEFLNDPDKRKYYWKYKSETIPVMLNTVPNPAHYAIGELDRKGKLFWLLTQNVDGLHELGGVSKNRIVELHGTNREAVCTSCGETHNINEILKWLEEENWEPRCYMCGGFIKPNTVSFGQELNPDNLRTADMAAGECDLFMALGSSLVVQPVCGLVEVAHKNGRPIIIINRDKTPYDDIARYKLTEPLEEIMPILVIE